MGHRSSTVGVLREVPVTDTALWLFGSAAAVIRGTAAGCARFTGQAINGVARKVDRIERRMRVLELRMKKEENRLRRQFEAIERKAPVGGRALQALRRGEYRTVRIPLGVFLVIGGMMAFLPIFGVWMLPLGLLLLSVDIPRLRGCVSAAIIRSRRRLDIWGRRLRRWRSG